MTTKRADQNDPVVVGGQAPSAARPVKPTTGPAGIVYSDKKAVPAPTAVEGFVPGPPATAINTDGTLKGSFPTQPDPPAAQFGTSGVLPTGNNAIANDVSTAVAAARTAGKTAINTGVISSGKPATAVDIGRAPHAPVSVMSNRIARIQSDNARETFLSKALEAISQKDGAIEAPKLDQMLTSAVDSSFKLPSTMARNAGGTARDVALPEGVSGPLALNTGAGLNFRTQFERGQGERAIARGEDPTEFTGDTGQWSEDAADAFRKADPENALGLMNHPNPESLMNADGTLKPGAKAELEAIQVAESRAGEKKKDELNLIRDQNGAYTEKFVGRRTGMVRERDAGAANTAQANFDAKWNPSANTTAQIQADAIKQNIQNVWQGDQNARAQALERELSKANLRSAGEIARLVGLFGLSETEIRANVDRLNNQETNQTARHGQDVVSKTADKDRVSQEGDPSRKATAAIKIDAATVNNDVLRNQARGGDSGAGDELYKRGLDAFTPEKLDKSDDPVAAEESAMSDILSGIRGTGNAQDRATRTAALADKLENDKRFGAAFDRLRARQKSKAIETKK